MVKVVTRTARSPALGPQGSSREPERRLTSPSFSRVAKVIRGPLAIRSPKTWTVRLHGLPESARNHAFERVVLTIVSSWQKSVER